MTPLRRSMFAVILTVGLCALPAWGQAPSEPDPDDPVASDAPDADQPAAEEDAAHETQPDADAPGDKPEQDRRQEELKYLTELRREVTKEIRLSDEQTEAVRDLFKAHTEFVENYRPEPQDEVDPQELQKQQEEIRAQIREARRQRDRQRVMQLMEKMRAIEPGDEIRQATLEFHRKLAEELDPDQQQQLREIIRRLYRRGNPMDDMRERTRAFRTMRVVLSELQLTEEQQQSVQTIFRDAMSNLGRDNADRDAVSTLESDMREKILNLLDDEQQAKFEERMAYFEEHPEAIPGRPQRGNRPGRDRGGRRGSGPAAPQAEPPADPPDDQPEQE